MGYKKGKHANASKNGLISMTERRKEWIKVFAKTYGKNNKLFTTREFQEKYRAKAIANSRKKTRKKIVQIAKDGSILQSWSSITEASKTLNIDPGNISACCRKKRNAAGGYRWNYIC